MWGWFSIKDVIPGFNVDRNNILLHLKNGELVVLSSCDKRKSITEIMIGEWRTADNKTTCVTHWCTISRPETYE